MSPLGSLSDHVLQHVLRERVKSDQWKYIALNFCMGLVLTDFQ